MVRQRQKRSSKFSKAIQSLKSMKANQRYTAIRNANDKFIKDIVSHVRKLRTKKLSPKLEKLVKQHSKKLRYISNPKVSLRKKRKALSQKGGALPALLAMLTPVLAPFVSSIMGR